MFGTLTIGSLVSMAANIEFTIEPSQFSLLVDGTCRSARWRTVDVAGDCSINSQGLGIRLANIDVLSRARHRQLQARSASSG